VNDDVEVTVVMRGPRYNFPEDLLFVLEELFDCDVLSVDEEEV
jgi:hypothetical protein